MPKQQNIFAVAEIDRIIEMAWEDRTPFEAIEQQFGISESGVIELMRREMKASSFRMWRKRVSGRATKHTKLRTADITRFKSPMQREIAGNKISKRRSKY
ncbi:MAG: TIGR03643 family protein [Candidatus Kapabacteria bacterium]|nr:TIGR03643 family protein [Candidatus Kapabacteria bacterium]